MTQIIKDGWIRFMDESPPIGDIVIVAYSSSPYNDASFAHSGKMVDNDTVLLDGHKFSVPIYNTEDFDSINKAKGIFCVAYAHHWAYNTEENRKNLRVHRICEYDRRKSGKKQPIDVSSAQTIE